MAKINTKQGQIVFKQKQLYPGIKRINKVVSTKNLLDVKKIFDEAGLYFGLIYGTLLGCIRENDFIFHDEDIDLFILSEDEDEFKVLLFELFNIGFDLIRYERSGLYSIARNDEYIDFYVMRPFSTKIRWNGADNFVIEKYLIETKYIDFKGSKFLVPVESEELLELIYGSKWREPIIYFNYQAPKIKVVLLKLFFIIRRLLPKPIYNFYLAVYYKPRYKKLLEKAKAIGIKDL